MQTEDSGPANPHIFTHLYFAGTILASKKHQYDSAAPEDVVRALMQSQHKAILKELKASAHDARIGAFFASRGEPLDLEATNEPAPERSLEMEAATPTPMPVLDESTQPQPPPSFDDAPAVPLSRPAPDGPGVYAVRQPRRESPFEKTPHPNVPSSVPGRAPTPPVVIIPSTARRRPVRPVAPSGSSPVVVQRTVVVGTHPPGGLQPGAPRPRRPAQAIPYVVKEGSHPLAQPGPLAPPPQAELPPARPIAPPAPMTTAPRTTAAPPPKAGEPLVEKSLDEVILAYLAQGGDNEPR